MTRKVLICGVLLLAATLQCCTAKAPLGPGSTGSGKRQLKRQGGKRWDAIHEVVRAEIKSATKRFLEERSRALVLPIEIDILLVGFDGDGGYGYKLDRPALEELLGSATEDNTICPTVWETGESAAVCFSVNYILLEPPKDTKAVERIEDAIRSNMEWVGDRSQDWPDGSRDVSVYEVEASGEIEAVVWDLLDEAYGGSHPDGGRSQHSQIVVVNPSKRRMRGAGLPAPHYRHHHHQAAGGMQHNSSQGAGAPAHHGPEVDFIEEWKRGTVSGASVVEQEAGFLYRYRYGGRGGGAAVVSQYNFLLIDVAAGPVSYGPLASPSGSVSPTAMPRLMPMLLRMTKELERNTAVGTYREHLLEEAARGARSLFAGQLAATLAAAARHLFATDLRLSAGEALGGGGGGGGGPRRVVVPIVVMQDHNRDLSSELSADGLSSRWVDTDLVQLALDEMLPPEVAGAVGVSSHILHHHRAIAAALIKARHTRSDAVLSEPPDTGLHRSHTSSLDSGLLLSELHRATTDPDAPGGSYGLLGGLEDHLHEDYVAAMHASEDPDGFLDAKRQTTKVLPVYVFSLQRSPDQLMFDNRHLVAAGGHGVAVLQLLAPPSHDDPHRGRVYSGHMAEGHHLLSDAGESPTRSVIAGLAEALGGLVPPHQRWCGAEGGVVEDWRWAVGAVPWGPHSNYTVMSSIFSTTARRNLLLGRIEVPLRRLMAALDSLDAFIATHLQGPFAFLSRTVGSGSGSANMFGQMHPQHRLLDLLARHHVRYHNATPPPLEAVRSLLGGAGGLGLGRKPAGAKPAPAPSPPSHSADDGAHGGGEGHGEGQGGQHNHDRRDWDGEGHGQGEGGEQGGHGGGAQGDGQQGQSPPPLRRFEDVVSEQEALSPDVAARLQHSLEQIGEKLEQISFYMYSRNWPDLDDALPSFAAAVESFAAAAARDLAHAAEVVGCCAVTHGSAARGAATWFVLAVLLLALGGFAVLAFVAIRSQRLYAPPGGRLGGGGLGGLGGIGGLGGLGGGGGMSRHSSKGSMRTASGSLPQWVGPQGGGLPR